MNTVSAGQRHYGEALQTLIDRKPRKRIFLVGRRGSTRLCTSPRMLASRDPSDPSDPSAPESDSQP